MNTTLETFGIKRLAIERLDSSLAKLRGKGPSCANGLSPAPIRVLPDDEEPGHYLVVDGFKRLAAARRAGCDEIVVLIEPPLEGLAGRVRAHALILACNAPKTTLSPMDEVRVVASLIDDEGLSPTRVARLLGKRKCWVSKRLTLARGLAAEVARALDARALTLTLAYALTKLSKEQQVPLYRRIAGLGLSLREALALLESYRALADPCERLGLLEEPEPYIEEIRRAKHPHDHLGLGHSVQQRIERYRRIQKLLSELDHEPDLPHITPDEKRLLDAERRRLEAAIGRHASAGHRSPGSQELRSPASQEVFDEYLPCVSSSLDSHAPRHRLLETPDRNVPQTQHSRLESSDRAPAASRGSRPPADRNEGSDQRLPTGSGSSDTRDSHHDPHQPLNPSKEEPFHDHAQQRSSRRTSGLTLQARQAQEGHRSQAGH